MGAQQIQLGLLVAKERWIMIRDRGDSGNGNGSLKCEGTYEQIANLRCLFFHNPKITNSLLAFVSLFDLCYIYAVKEALKSI